MPRTSDTAELASCPRFLELPESGLAGTMATLGTGLACFLTQWIGVALWLPSEQLSAVWIPGGLMLAVALLTEPRRWPVLVTAATTGSTSLLVILGLVPPLAGLVLGLLTGLQTVVIAGALRAVLRRAPTLTSLLEFLTYLVVVVGGSAVASSLVLAAAWGFGIRAATFATWRTIALSVVLGYLTVTPTVVLLLQEAESFRHGTARRWIEAGILALLLAVTSGLLFSGTVSRSVTWTGLAMILPPLLLWSAMRFGTLGASTSLLLISVISTAATSHGLGPFTTQSPEDSTLSLQLFILGAGLPLLGLAAALSEQQRTSAALQWSHVRLRGLNRELMAVREEEASRIARELHDDVGQQLALISIGLSRLRQAHIDRTPGCVSDIARLQEQTNAVVASLRQISHQLHPAALEHVGLVTSLQLMCEEVHQATDLDLYLVSHSDITVIPRDITLCLYRVAQEALNNVIRHARAHRVDLSLGREGTHLILQVTDNGRGFTSGVADQGTGLGVRYASERVRAVGGTLTVKSEPGAGTTVRASVPLRRAVDA